MLPVSVSDIIKALEAFPGWKAVAALPKRLAELEARVAALEKAAVKPPGGSTDCPNCGKPMTFKGEKPHRTFGSHGVKVRDFVCADCHMAVERQWSAGKGYF